MSEAPSPRSRVRLHPARGAYGSPEPSPDLTPGIEAPPTVTTYARPGAAGGHGATV